MCQLWEYFKLTPSLSDSIWNDSKTTSTAHKCRQAHCGVTTILINGTVNKKPEDDSRYWDEPLGTKTTFRSIAATTYMLPATTLG